MKATLTSLIEKYDVNREAFDERFQVTAISYDSLSQKASAERNDRFATLARDIYAAGQVLSMVKDGKGKRYLVLLKKGTSFEFQDCALSVRSLPVYEVPDWALAVLLIRALPNTLKQSNERNWIRFEAEGLYYLIKRRPLKLVEGFELTTVGVDLTWCQQLRRHMLEIGVKTFAPLEFFRRDGKVPSKIANMPRYSLDLVRQQVSKSFSGDYIKRKPFPKQRSRVDAYDIQKSSTEDYYSSRLGVLSLFFEDLKYAYGDLFRLQLERITPDQYRRISDNTVSKHYQKIYALLQEQPVRVVNKSRDPEAGLRLIAALDRHKVVGLDSEEIDEAGLNLLIVDDKDSYASDEEDPYKLTRQAHPNAIIQSCYPERLQGEGASHVVEVLLKELLIKQEVKLQRFLIDYPELPEGAIFVLPMRSEDEDLGRNAPWPLACCEIRNAQARFFIADESWAKDVQAVLTMEQNKSLFQGYERNPFVWMPQDEEVLIFSETGAISLPEHEQLHEWVKEIESSRESSIPAAILRTYMANHPESELIPELETIVDGAIADRVPAVALEAIGYRKKEERHFHDYLAAQGCRLKAPFAAEDPGALNAVTGIWINNERKIYYAGSKGSPTRKQATFCRLYHVDWRGEGLPSWLPASLEVFHIRHKGVTVLPYVFKHVREYFQFMKARVS